MVQMRMHANWWHGGERQLPWHLHVNQHVQKFGMCVQSRSWILIRPLHFLAAASAPEQYMQAISVDLAADKSSFLFSCRKTASNPPSNLHNSTTERWWLHVMTFCIHTGKIWSAYLDAYRLNRVIRYTTWIIVFTGTIFTQCTKISISEIATAVLNFRSQWFWTREWTSRILYR